MSPEQEKELKRLLQDMEMWFRSGKALPLLPKDLELLKGLLKKDMNEKK